MKSITSTLILLFCGFYLYGQTPKGEPFWPIADFRLQNDDKNTWSVISSSQDHYPFCYNDCEDTWETTIDSLQKFSLVYELTTFREDIIDSVLVEINGENQYFSDINVVECIKYNKEMTIFTVRIPIPTSGIYNFKKSFFTNKDPVTWIKTNFEITMNAPTVVINKRINETVVELEQTKKDISINPNPVSASLNLVIPKSCDGKISIHDANGKLVYSKQMYFENTEINIPLSDWKNGTYHLQFENKNNKKVYKEKFVKQ